MSDKQGTLPLTSKGMTSEEREEKDKQLYAACMQLRNIKNQLKDTPNDNILLLSRQIGGVLIKQLKEELGIKTPQY